MGLTDTVFGNPGTTVINQGPSSRPPGYGAASQIFNYLTSLAGTPYPSFSGSLDPGMSPTLTDAIRRSQGYAQSSPSELLQGTQGILGRMMNPSFANPQARMFGGAPDYYGIDPNQRTYGGRPAGDYQFQSGMPNFQNASMPGQQPFPGLGGGPLSPAGGFDPAQGGGYGQPGQGQGGIGQFLQMLMQQMGGGGMGGQGGGGMPPMPRSGGSPGGLVPPAPPGVDPYQWAQQYRASQPPQGPTYEDYVRGGGGFNWQQPGMGGGGQMGGQGGNSFGNFQGQAAPGAPSPGGSIGQIPAGGGSWQPPSGPALPGQGFGMGQNSPSQPPMQYQPISGGAYPQPQGGGAQTMGGPPQQGQSGGLRNTSMPQTVVNNPIGTSPMAGQYQAPNPTFNQTQPGWTPQATAGAGGAPPSGPFPTPQPTGKPGYGLAPGTFEGSVPGAQKAWSMGNMSNYGQTKVGPDGQKQIYVGGGGGESGQWKPFDPRFHSEIETLFNRYGSDWSSGSRAGGGHSGDIAGHFRDAFGRAPSLTEKYDMFYGVPGSDPKSITPTSPDWKYQGPPR
jgi:hypothetical protein